MKYHYRLLKLFGSVLGIIVILQLMAGCSTNRGVYSKDGVPIGTVSVDDIPNAVPKSEARSHYGNPSSYVVGGKRYYVMKSANGYDKVGYASWYGTKFHGHNTSNREAYNMYSMTAASPVLPIPTYIQVTNLNNGKSVVVRVNDRGPFKSNRIVDLSYAAAKKLGYANGGTALVRVTAINTDSFKNSQWANNQSPTILPVPKNIPKPLAKAPVQLASTATNKLYLQVGVFKNRDKALTMSKTIGKLTQANVSVKTSYTHQTPIYKVHIGPFADSTQSDKIKQVLAQHGIEKPVAVAG